MAGRAWRAGARAAAAWPRAPPLGWRLALLSALVVFVLGDGDGVAANAAANGAGVARAPAPAPAAPEPAATPLEDQHAPTQGTSHLFAPPTDGVLRGRFLAEVSADAMAALPHDDALVEAIRAHAESEWGWCCVRVLRHVGVVTGRASACDACNSESADGYGTLAASGGTAGATLGDVPGGSRKAALTPSQIKAQALPLWLEGSNGGLLPSGVPGAEQSVAVYYDGYASVTLAPVADEGSGAIGQEVGGNASVLSEAAVAAAPWGPVGTASSNEFFPSGTDAPDWCVERTWERLGGDAASYGLWNLDRMSQPKLLSGGKDEGAAAAKGAQASAYPLDGLYQSPECSHGLGVDVYMLDTGVRKEHGAFKFYESLQPGTNLLESDAEATDEHGHGSHTMGTMCGHVFGAAKRARCHPLKVLDLRGGSPWSVIIAGVDWALAHANSGRPKVINMSLQGPRSAPAEVAVRRAVDAGAVVVVAAGNFAADACGSSPGALGGPTDGVITVGALDRKVDGELTASSLTFDQSMLAGGSSGAATAQVPGDNEKRPLQALDGDTVAWYSNWGRCVDMYAPGSAVRSASHELGDGCGQWCSTLKSGTSMSAPAVAAAAAIVRSRFPDLSPAEVEVLLKRHADVLPSVQLGNAQDREAPVLMPRIADDVVPDGYVAPVSPPTAAPTSAPQQTHIEDEDMQGEGDGDETEDQASGQDAWKAESCEPSLAFVSNDRVNFLSVAYGPSGRMYAAYQDIAHDGRLTVAASTSAGWTPLGAPGGVSDGAVRHVKIAVSQLSGTIYVAYTDELHGHKALVKVYSPDDEWVAVGLDTGGIVSQGKAGYQPPANAQHELPTQLAARLIFDMSIAKTSSIPVPLPPANATAPKSTAQPAAESTAELAAEAYAGELLRAADDPSADVPPVDSFGLALVVDPVSDGPVVAFRDAGGDDRLAVLAYHANPTTSTSQDSAARWAAMGTYAGEEANNATASSHLLPWTADYVDMAADPANGLVYLAFCVSGKLRVMRVTAGGGSSIAVDANESLAVPEWEHYGKQLLAFKTKIKVISPSIDVDADGRVVIAFTDASVGARAAASVMTRRDNRWHFLGLPGITEAPTAVPLVRVHPALGMVYLFYRDPIAGGRGTVRVVSEADFLEPSKDASWRLVGEPGGGFGEGFVLAFDVRFAPLADGSAAPPPSDADNISAVAVSDGSQQGVGRVFCRATPPT